MKEVPVADIQILHNGPVIKRRIALRDGLRKYFTGKPCKNGHVAERWVGTRGCCGCDHSYDKKFYEKHKEKEMIRKAKYYIKNKQKILLQQKKRLEENKEKVLFERAQSHLRRRSKIFNIEGFSSKDDILKIFNLQKGKCAYCKKKITFSYHVDHIIPVSKGGSNWPKNLQLTCRSCNLRKGAKDPIVFSRQNGLLI
jgi:5-methylcytosine-specific restriction endonuclease McrA